MKGDSLYNPEIWQSFVEKAANPNKEFELKTYPHFDPFYNLSLNIDKLHLQVSDKTLMSVAKHSFLPFVKILLKTPRYRYQEKEGVYELETKIRPIAFASHYDTYLYAFYAHALNKQYQNYIKERGFDEVVIAYRDDLGGKCNIQFAKEVFEKIGFLTHSGKAYTAIALDIKGYFDNINHIKLKEKWCKVLGKSELPIDQYKVYRSLTNYAYSNLNSFLKHFKIKLDNVKKEGKQWQSLLDLLPGEKHTKNSFNKKFTLLRERKLLVNNLNKQKGGTADYKGIPQGSSMSSVLSNIYLIDFDEWLFNLSVKEGFFYRRYCDDLIVVCESPKVKEINELIVNEILNKYSLVIQDKKTELIEFRETANGKIRAFDKKKVDAITNSLSKENEGANFKNLQYLGFEFNGSNIYIRSSSLSRYFKKMKDRIVRSVLMAYGKNGKGSKVYRKQIYNRYSHIGNHNFISYALNASKRTYTNKKGTIYEGMDSKSIRKQLSAHFSIIEKEIRKTSVQKLSVEEKRDWQRVKKKKRRKAPTFKA